MKKKILLLSALLWSVSLAAQNIQIDTMVLDCRYLERMQVDTVMGRYATDTLTLHVGKRCCAFYSHHVFFVDSLQSLPGGSRLFMQLVSKLVSEGKRSSLQSNTGEYIYQNYPEGHITTRSRLLFDPVEITEKMDTPEWHQIDTCTVIEGYPCHLAEARFRGRTWYAWYTTEIPFRFGPWKLQGLPGLILDAYDQENHYRYTLMNLRQVDSEPVMLYNLRNYKFVKTKRKIYLRKTADYLGLSVAETVKLQTGKVELSERFSDQQPTIRYDMRERDYR